jgi:hypothetical protein
MRSRQWISFVPCSEYYSGSSWLDFYMIQGSSSRHGLDYDMTTLVTHDYNNRIVKPTMTAENYYESGTTQQPPDDQRRSLYLSVFALWDLPASRSFLSRIPDQSLIVCGQGQSVASHIQPRETVRLALLMQHTSWRISIPPPPSRLIQERSPATGSMRGGLALPPDEVGPSR